MGGGDVGAGPAPLTFLTLGIFQAEAGLVALGHLSAVGGQDVIVGEDVHAVVVPEGDRVRPHFLASSLQACPIRSCPSPHSPLTRDTRATPRSGAPPWA